MNDRDHIIRLPRFHYAEFPRKTYTFHVPDDGKVLFSENEVWLYIEEDMAVLGITDWAQRIMGELVYFSPPAAGSRIEQFAAVGELESVKAVLEIVSPVSGEIVEINQALRKKPQLANTAPFAEGWVCVMRLAHPAKERDSLLDFAEYARLMQRKADDYNR